MEPAGSGCLGLADVHPPEAGEGAALMRRSERDAAADGRSVGFVLVHAGAGYHSESKAKEYKQVCKKACQKAIEKLQTGALAVDVVAAALIELEDSPFTNAGMGSNLNLSGDIECDASTMDGKSLNFGAVGALRGIKNPILVANKLLSEAQKGKLSAGRIPPCFLVGEGAHKWAVDHGIVSCSPDIMATKFSLSAFRKNRRKLELAEKVETEMIQTKKRREVSENECLTQYGCLSGYKVNWEKSEILPSNVTASLDTVGAVVVDHEGNVAAAVSSGGLAMKHPGRVGQAAVYGCGCWAENTGGHNVYSTAVSTSEHSFHSVVPIKSTWYEIAVKGCGEHLVRTMLARECSVALQAEDAHQALLETMQKKFVRSPFLASEDSVLGGVIVLRCCSCSLESESSLNREALLVEFLWSHTTESMCVGYMSTQDGKAKQYLYCSSLSRLCFAKFGL
ncbi:threonine aspartase 1 isoform X3 [Narcine bancroftii]|uniref:threonine aspartase 1 isoform X3 n=1 Tax=Narcine bancroftii TaxID=1343680 RepID=UPI003831A7BD